MFEKALIFAAALHAGQVDKSGKPYIFHPVRVASTFTDDTERTIAVLHDVMEDCGVTRDDLEKEFSAEVADAVATLTRQHTETYLEFIQRVSLDPVAREIKIADILDNLRPGAEHLRPRYEEALRVLRYESPQTHANGEPVRLTYMNWRGETSERTIKPIRIYWGSSEWHPEPQWLLTAFDLEKNAERDFALKDFGRTPSPQTHLSGLDEATKQKLREALRFSASRSVMTAEDERRILSALEATAPAQHVKADPDYCFDPDDWEFTCHWADRDEVHGHGDALKLGDPMRVCTLVKGPDKWVADVPIEWDDEGDVLETEIRWFDTEADARSALATEGKA